MTNKVLIQSREPILKFFRPTDYNFAFTPTDQENVSNVVSFLQEDSSVFLITDVAKNISEGKFPKYKETPKYLNKMMHWQKIPPNWEVPYEVINLAAVNSNCQTLSNRIKSLSNHYDVDKSLISDEEIKKLGETFIGASPTPRTKIEDLLSPIDSYRFSFSNEYNRDSSKDIVVGVYEQFSFE
ncbi:MAG: hypothetical protein OQK82_02285 [Candidatus Pacearchaeota archaeon]|nr:hypothetical protein [Candidatus Pacearchaeota archaeon]